MNKYTLVSLGCWLSLIRCFCSGNTLADEPRPIRHTASSPESIPWNLKELSEAPDFAWDAGDEIRSLYYSGDTYQGKPTRVFAYYATPDTIAGRTPIQQRFPAIVLVHGGGGTAFPQWVRLWAERGYAAIAMDLAGCGPDKVRLSDGGPGQGHNMKFETIGQPKTEQWTYHAVANVIRAHSLIQTFPEVDPDHTAITGISWGGYLTCIVAGLDNRFRAAVPVYGCGFLRDNSAWLDDFAKMSSEHQAKWGNLWDPSQYVGSASMPMLFVNGGKDGAYPPDSHAKTFALVKSPKYLHFVPNLPHGHIFDRPKAIEVFVDHQIKGGPPLARVSEPRVDGDKATAKVETNKSLVEANIHYTDGTLFGNPSQRKWETKPATIDGNVITAETTSTATAWFFTVKDERDTLVSSPLVFAN
jgi:dienelactone hydrolase